MSTFRPQVYVYRNVYVRVHVALTDRCARAMHLQGVWQASSSSSAGHRTAPEYQTRIPDRNTSHTVILYYTMLLSRSVLDQLAKGLSVLGVLEAVKLYPKIMESL